MDWRRNIGFWDPYIKEPNMYFFNFCIGCYRFSGRRGGRASGRLRAAENIYIDLPARGHIYVYLFNASSIFQLFLAAQKCEKRGPPQNGKGGDWCPNFKFRVLGSLHMMGHPASRPPLQTWHGLQGGVRGQVSPLLDFLKEIKGKSSLGPV